MPLPHYLAIYLLIVLHEVVICENERILGAGNEALVAGYDTVLLDGRYNVRAYWRRSVEYPETHVDLGMMAPGRVYIATSFGARMSMVTTVGSRGIGPVVIGMLPDALGMNYVIPGVYQYNIDGYSVQNTHLLPEEFQTISNTRINYDGDSTLLLFSRPYEALGHEAEREIPKDTIAVMGWAWAVGPGPDYIYHGGNVGFQFVSMDFTPGGSDMPVIPSTSPISSYIAETPSGTPIPSSSPPPSPSAAPSPLPDPTTPCDSAVVCLGRGVCTQISNPENGGGRQWHCACDPGYSGSRCHTCALGYAQVSNSLLAGTPADFVECVLAVKSLGAQLRITIPIFLTLLKLEGRQTKLVEKEKPRINVVSPAALKDDQTQRNSLENNEYLAMDPTGSTTNVYAKFGESKVSPYPSSQDTKRKITSRRAERKAITKIEHGNPPLLNSVRVSLLRTDLDTTSTTTRPIKSYSTWTNNEENKQKRESEISRNHLRHEVRMKRKLRRDRKLQFDNQYFGDTFSSQTLRYIQMKIITEIQDMYDLSVSRTVHRDNSPQNLASKQEESVDVFIIDDETYVAQIPFYIGVQSDNRDNAKIRKVIQDIKRDILKVDSVFGERIEQTLKEIVVFDETDGETSPDNNADEIDFGTDIWSGMILPVSQWTFSPRTQLLTSYLPTFTVLFTSTDADKISIPLSEHAHLHMYQDFSSQITHFRLRSTRLTWVGIASSPSEAMVGGDAIAVEPGKSFPNEITSYVLNGYTMSEVDTIKTTNSQFVVHSDIDDTYTFPPIRGLCPIYSLWYITATGNRILSSSVSQQRLFEATSTLSSLSLQQEAIRLELLDGEFVFPDKKSNFSNVNHLIVGYEAIFCRSIAPGNHPGARTMGEYSKGPTPRVLLRRNITLGNLEVIHDSGSLLGPISDESHSERKKIKNISTHHLENLNKHQHEYEIRSKLDGRKLHNSESMVTLTWAWGTEGFYYMSTHPILQSGSAEVDLISGTIRQFAHQKALVLGLPSWLSVFHVLLSLFSFTILLPMAGFVSVCGRKDSSVPGPLAAHTRTKSSLWQFATMTNVISLILAYAAYNQRTLPRETRSHEVAGLVASFGSILYVMLDLYLKRKGLSYLLSRSGRPVTLDANRIRTDNEKKIKYPNKSLGQIMILKGKDTKDPVPNNVTHLKQHGEQTSSHQQPSIVEKGRINATSNSICVNVNEEVQREDENNTKSKQDGINYQRRNGRITSTSVSGLGSNHCLNNAIVERNKVPWDRVIIGKDKAFPLLWYVRTYLGRLTILLGIVTCIMASIHETTCLSSTREYEPCWSEETSTLRSDNAVRTQPGHGWLIYTILSIIGIVGIWIAIFVWKRVKNSKFSS